MRRIMAVATVAVLVGCGGSTDVSGSDAGTGGASAAGGSGGHTGGAGGSSASGGSGPVAGECKTDEDCELGSSCCDCMAAPKGKLSMPYCPPDPCFADSCSAMQVDKARCIAGQCILGYDCDGSKVYCNALPPSCPAGQLPRVVNGCWGNCVPMEQCESVPDCFNCPAGTACVVYDAWSSDHHCVTPPAGCSASCSCLGQLLCVDGYDACTEMDDGSAIHCGCPAC